MRSIRSRPNRVRRAGPLPRCAGTPFASNFVLTGCSAIIIGAARSSTYQGYASGRQPLDFALSIEIRPGASDPYLWLGGITEKPGVSVLV
jgi:hypothetical protein